MCWTTGHCRRLVSVDPPVAWQGALFEPAPTGGGLSFDGFRQEHLHDRSWVDAVPAWVPDHAALLDLLLSASPWQQRSLEVWRRAVRSPGGTRRAPG